MKRALTGLLVLAFATLLNGKRFRCDYTYYPKAEGFLKLHTIPANWREARLRCHLEGSKLASPLNHKLATAMRSVMRTSGDARPVFTGISALISRGDFHSAEGVPLSKIPHTWAEGEPSNIDNKESCLIMQDDGKLADARCDQPRPYLCYRKNVRTAVVGNCGTVDPEYKFESRTGSCYKFHKVPRTWSRAYMACAAEGGHLVIINSETEAQVIRELFAKNPAISMRGAFYKDSALVGFYDWGEHGEFLTIEGQTLEEAGYAKFSPGEPSNSTGGQFCGAVYRTALYDDIWCESPYAFICEKSPDSLLCEEEQRSGMYFV